jgi:hypothetical protein
MNFTPRDKRAIGAEKAAKACLRKKLFVIPIDHFKGVVD